MSIENYFSMDESALLAGRLFNYAEWFSIEEEIQIVPVRSVDIDIVDVSVFINL